MSLNQVVISGRMGKDPEVRQISDSKSVVGFSLAVDDFYGGKKNTSWVYVEAWDKTAEVVGKLLSKGKRAAIVGRLREDTWEANGEKKSRLKVIADRVEVLDYPDDDDKAPF